MQNNASTTVNAGPLLTLTPSAGEHIKFQIAKEHEAVGMRLGIKKTGCSGYSYDFSFVKSIQPNDVVIEQHGAKIIISREDALYYAGVELDYIKQGLNRKLVIQNPNAAHECGCGKSFSLKSSQTLS